MVIHNGIDLVSVQRVESYPRASNERVVVVAGRMVAEKGQARALAAFALAAQRDPKLRLELIGDGPERALLERRAQQVGLADRVDFPGWRPREETLARMKSAWCVLVPSSSIQEGFGLVLVEAMALGVPVVASDIPVFREVAELGGGVSFTDPGNTAGLTEAILSEGLRTHVYKTKIDKTNMQKAYMSLYEIAWKG
jgi:glycosyltransferase involved in cell wall biosynthesis